MADNSPRGVSEEEGEEDNDDEWEYEYDENETEDFYITLDLTTHVRPHDRRSFPAREKPKNINWQAVRAQKRRRKRTTSQDTLDGGDLVPDLEEEEEEPPTPEPEPADDPLASSPPEPQEPEPDEEIQIMELESDNPVVAVGGKVYSCYWADAMGTDMLFEAPHPRDFTPNKQPADGPVDLPDAKLLATTRHRLVAEPMTLTPRTDAIAPGKAVAGAQASSGRRPETEVATPDRPQNPQRHRRDVQASFLQRLAAARRAKGEDDWVPMSLAELDMPKARRVRRSSQEIATAAGQAEIIEDDDSSGGEYDASGGWGTHAVASPSKARSRASGRGRRGTGIMKRTAREELLWEQAERGAYLDTGRGEGAFLLQPPKKRVRAEGELGLDERDSGQAGEQVSPGAGEDSGGVSSDDTSNIQQENE